MRLVSFLNVKLHSLQTEPKASDLAADSVPRYGGRRFSTASALPLHEGLIDPKRLLALVAMTLRRPRQAAALLVLLLRTPSEYVFVSGSVAGRALQRISINAPWACFRKTASARGADPSGVGRTI